MDKSLEIFLANAAGKRGNPEPVDLSNLAHLARTEGKYKSAYKPEGDCGCKLRLKEAVRFGWRHEAYADHCTYAVPVTVTGAVDVKVAHNNLYLFCNAARTANGMAGYGSTWSAHLEQIEGGEWVAIFDQRSSIAD